MFLVECLGRFFSSKFFPSKFFRRNFIFRPKKFSTKKIFDEEIFQREKFSTKKSFDMGFSTTKVFDQKNFRRIKSVPLLTLLALLTNLKFDGGVCYFGSVWIVVVVIGEGEGPRRSIGAGDTRRVTWLAHFLRKGANLSLVYPGAKGTGGQTAVAHIRRIPAIVFAT